MYRKLGKGKEQVLSRAKSEPQGGARILLRQEWGREVPGELECNNSLLLQPSKWNKQGKTHPFLFLPEQFNSTPCSLPDLPSQDEQQGEGRPWGRGLAFT